MNTLTDRFTGMIGQRIRVARKEAKLTQKELSDRLGFKDRQILANIEGGLRKISAEEIMKLIQTLGRDIEYFTDPLRLVGEGAFCWRAIGASSEALDTFEDKAKQWIAAYRAMGEDIGETPSPLVRQLAISTHSSYEDASRAAEQLIAEWGLGKSPAEQLPVVAEDRLKMLVLNIDPPPGISGAACHLPQFNTILINRHDADGRRAFDFAHELFHLLTWTSMPPQRLDSDTPESPKAKRREQLANNFAASLLMPRENVLALWQERRGQDIHDWFNKSAENLGVTASALKTRIRNMGLIGDADLFDINDERLTWNGKTPSNDHLPLPYSRNFVKRLSDAIGKGFISVRKCARLLDCTVEDTADLIKAYGYEPPFDI